ncbi:MAG: NAD(P)H-binding protein [Synechococcaceae cyanobacterium SM2_3_1]|nr:NAD(P)H-binding protein [Synechococcaceae cyanobacterium SM2_3_1]
MKIVVFGFTGSIGQHVVRQALRQGHAVTAFTRNPAKLQIQDPNLSVVQGDVLNSNTVEKAVRGQDAVICVLKGRKQFTGTIRSEGTQQIIQAIKEIW